MSKDSNGVSTFLTGLLIGGIIGSVTALLYSPISGKKFRKKISTVKDDIVEEINEYYETGKEKAEELIKESKKKADTLIEEARKIVSG